MSTIYTVNNKVLKNSANDKWLTKKEAPAGYILDSTNLEGAGYDMGNPNSFIGGIWRGPEYPNGYDGTGHKLRITVRNNITIGLGNDSNKQIVGWYLNTTAAGYVSAGPNCLMPAYFISDSDVNIPVGVYEFDFTTQSTGDYGKYLFLVFAKASTTTAGYTSITSIDDLLNNVTMEIV